MNHGQTISAPVSAKAPIRRPPEKNVWVEVTKRKGKGKEVDTLQVDPSPTCIVPPLKEEGSSSQVLQSSLAQVPLTPLVVTKGVGSSPSVQGKASKAQFSSIAERKILLNKIHDLQLLRKTELNC